MNNFRNKMIHVMIYI